ncbi:hypothetical protein D3C72_1789650 [compost metagenome]
MRSSGKELTNGWLRAPWIRVLHAVTLLGLWRATLAARASAVAAALPVGTTSSTRPMASALAASTRSPHKIMRLAQPSPTSHGKCCVPPAHGSKPTDASGKAICACSSAMRMSQASAHSSPPPMA